MEEADKQRVVFGLSTAVAAKGYADTTIADIVRHARVSKRTFYEQFPDKEACFLEAYRQASLELQALLLASRDPALGAEAQIERTLGVYVAALEQDPARTRTFLLEIYAAGPRALRVRREVHDQFASLLLQLSRGSALEAAAPGVTTALVGAIHELVLVALETAKPIATIRATAVDVAKALLLRGRRRATSVSV